MSAKVQECSTFAQAGDRSGFGACLEIRRANDEGAGSILVGLLWCLAVLAVVVVGVLHTARLELRVGKNQVDSIQAYYLALAGVEKAKALLYHESRNRVAGGGQSQEFFDAPRHFRDVTLGRGQFRVIRQGRRDESAGIIYGVSDEESRLNVNRVSAEEMTKLYGLTAETAASIIDYRDEDHEVSPGGAEAEAYASLRPPALPRNGPLRTVRELLRVRGISREAFLGEDVNQNGLLDPEENDGSASPPADNRDGYLDAGWSGHVTLDSGVRNATATGQDRVNVQTADETALQGVAGFSAEIAKAIVSSRGRKQIESLGDLLDVRAANPNAPNSSGGANNLIQPGIAPGPALGVNASPGNPASEGGEKLISEDLLIEVADEITVKDDVESLGAMNINTAGLEVLVCLPGISQELAQAIISHRQSSGPFRNAAGLLRVPGMSREIFKQAEPRVCARSETFRIVSEGILPGTGTRKRLQMIVRVTASGMETLSYREDL